jgi:hypothetical protein
MVVLSDSETNHGSNATKIIHAGLPEGHDFPDVALRLPPANGLKSLRDET